MTDLAILAAVVVAFGLISRRLDSSPLTAPMVFVGAGMLAGPSVLGLVELPLNDELILMIAEITLVLVLFSDASRIDFRALRRNAALPGRLLGIGLPLTIAAGLLAGLALLGELEFWEAAVLAAVLAPTDAALGQVVVTSPAVPRRIRQALNVESGLNDGLSVPFLTLFLAAAVVEEDIEPASYWLRFVAEQIGLGVLIGVGTGLIGGWALARLAGAGWVTGVFMQLIPLALAVIAWAGATEAGGNGFIAAFVAGIAAGATTSVCREHVLDFSEDEGQLLTLATFFIFGAVIAAPALDEVTVEIILYAVLSLTLVRMLPVALALIGTGLRVPSIGFLGWFGPRGIASIVLALIVLEEAEIQGADDILIVTAVVVTGSVLLHGLTAAPAARAYARAAGAMSTGAEQVPVPEIAARSPMLDEGGRSPVRSARRVED